MISDQFVFDVYQSADSQLPVHSQLKTGFMRQSLFLDKCGWDVDLVSQIFTS